MVVLGGVAFSYERGTPIERPLLIPTSRPFPHQDLSARKDCSGFGQGVKCDPQEVLGRS